MLLRVASSRVGTLTYFLLLKHWMQGGFSEACQQHHCGSEQASTTQTAIDNTRSL